MAMVFEIMHSNVQNLTTIVTPMKMTEITSVYLTTNQYIVKSDCLRQATYCLAINISHLTKDVSVVFVIF